MSTMINQCPAQERYARNYTKSARLFGMRWLKAEHFIASIFRFIWLRGDELLKDGTASRQAGSAIKRMDKERKRKHLNQIVLLVLCCDNRSLHGSGRPGRGASVCPQGSY